jgi:branched-subunit amino acid transport protein AzlD
MSEAMTFAELGARYQETSSQTAAYVAGLPLWVNVWRGWMFLVFAAGALFVFWRREARWLALAMVVSLVAYNLVAMVSGVGRFPSIAFVALWSPLAVYLVRRRSGLPRERPLDRAYARWVDVTAATLVVSLAFDVYNVAYSLVRGVP